MFFSSAEYCLRVLRLMALTRLRPRDQGSWPASLPEVPRNPGDHCDAPYIREPLKKFSVVQLLLWLSDQILVIA